MEICRNDVTSGLRSARIKRLRLASCVTFSQKSMKISKKSASSSSRSLYRIFMLNVGSKEAEQKRFILAGNKRKEGDLVFLTPFFLLFHSYLLALPRSTYTIYSERGLICSFGSQRALEFTARWKSHPVWTERPWGVYPSYNLLPLNLE